MTRERWRWAALAHSGTQCDSTSMHLVLSRGKMLFKMCHRGSIYTSQGVHTHELCR